MKARFLTVVSILFVTASCGLKNKLPEGAPPSIKQEQLEESIKSNALDFERIRFSGKGSFNDGTKSQNFKYEVRLLKDSLVWLSLSDPILGIKLARGIITKNELSYYNSIQGNYFKGKAQELEGLLQFDFDFKTLFPVLCANMIELERDLEMNYIPEAYQLLDYDPTGKNPPDSQQISFHDFEIDPTIFRPKSQKVNQPLNGKKLIVTYENYKTEDIVFPSKIIFEYTETAHTTIELNVDKLAKDENFGFPYKIPSRYEPLN